MIAWLSARHRVEVDRPADEGTKRAVTTNERGNHLAL
jgi:hypothetical protein